MTEIDPLGNPEPTYVQVANALAERIPTQRHVMGLLRERGLIVRGNITSHRARSMTAGQPYNAKEPMTLFELQAALDRERPNREPERPVPTHTR